MKDLEKKVEELQEKLKEAQAVIMFYTKSGETREIQGAYIETDVDAGPMYHKEYIPMCDGGVLAKRYIEKYKLWGENHIYYHPILDMQG